MLSFLRFALALASTAVGWAATIGISIFLLWGTWTVTFELCIQAEIFLDTTLPVSQPPEIQKALWFGAALCGALVLLQLIFHLLWPMRWQLRRLAPGFPLEKLDKDHGLAVQVRQQASALGVPCPTLWILGSSATNAFAYAPLGRSAIVLNAGLVNALPPRAVCWVLAHELAHLKHGDARSASFWVFASRGLAFGVYLRNATFRLLGRLGSFLPIAFLIHLPLHFLAQLSMFAWRLGAWFFRFFDLALGRAMEYRCDRVASHLTSPTDGVEALTRLTAIEPSFGGLFASHPSLKTRIKKIKNI